MKGTLALAFPQPEKLTITQTSNETEKTKQLPARINQPVKWVKEIKKNQSNYEIQLPQYASNISIEKIDEATNKKEKLKLKEKPKEYGIAIAPTPDINKTFIIENATEINITYETPAPISIENNFSSYKKQIIIQSDYHYENILSYTQLPTEVQQSSIKLYWLLNNTRQQVATTNYDKNNNSLIDYIEWVTPSLSNQTYEIELTILTIQSFTTVGGNWIVEFNTSGTANLTIKAINGTTFEDGIIETQDDLEFLEVLCVNIDRKN